MLLLDHGFLSLWLEMNDFSGTNSTADESKIYMCQLFFFFFAMHNPFSSSAKSKSPNYRGSNFMFWGQNAIFVHLGESCGIVLFMHWDKNIDLLFSTMTSFFPNSVEWEGYARKVKSIGFIVKLRFWLFNYAVVLCSVNYAIIFPYESKCMVLNKG